MVISSFALSPFPGFGVRPSDTTQIVQQDTLGSRLPPSSTTGSSPPWYTHPDQLLWLMKNAREYTRPTDRDWHILIYANPRDLIVDVVNRLYQGWPSIIPIDPSNHWVVIVSAEVDDAGNILRLGMQEPLPVCQHQVIRNHTYYDGCNDNNNGSSYCDPTQALQDNLPNPAGCIQPIGDFSNPSGLLDYTGRFVGVVYGPVPTYKRTPVNLVIEHRPFDPSDPLVLDPYVLLEELGRKSKTWNVPALRAMLPLDETPIIKVVQDIESVKRPYTLLSVFSEKLKYGFAAVFRTDGVLQRLQFFNDRRVDHSLRQVPDATLWWTRRWLPSLESPFFPFQKKADSTDKYIRPFDGVELTFASE
jgi:hypothetical protein